MNAREFGYKPFKENVDIVCTSLVKLVFPDTIVIAARAKMVTEQSNASLWVNRKPYRPEIKQGYTLLSLDADSTARRL
jgi:hypothetical protein